MGKGRKTSDHGGVIYIVASPLAAWLMSVLPIQGILAIDVVTASAAIVTLLLVRIPQPEAVLENRAPFIRGLVEGARYFSSQCGLFLMVATDALRRLVTVAPFTMLPLLVTRQFDGRALELGWLHSAYGFGYVLGGLALSTWGGFKRRLVTALIGLFGYGLSMFAIGAAPGNGYWLALGGCLGIGAFLQSYVPSDMQGRVFSLKRGLRKLSSLWDCWSAALWPMCLVYARCLSWVGQYASCAASVGLARR